jgi:predicted transposase YbfD/YdcC
VYFETTQEDTMSDLYDNTWIGFFQTLPDPRQRRGCRFPWWVLLTIVMAALVSDHPHPKAMHEWVVAHAATLKQTLWPRLPSEATLRRTLRLVDVVSLEARLRYRTEGTAPLPTTGLQARSLDGKTLRGAKRHGKPVHVVEEVVQESGQVIWQQAVTTKSNEIPLVQRMLANRKLHGILYTMDALHSQVETATRILNQGGHYLMIIKKNQKLLFHTLTGWFADAGWPEEQAAVIRTCDYGHGRHEHRTLERRSTVHLLPLWPGMQQAMKRVTESWEVTTGKYRTQTTYALTSLALDQASAPELERYWRGHWTIENRVHYVRAVAFHEDAGQSTKGNTPLVLAALRNGALNHLHLAGTPNIAAALRQMGEHVHLALAFVGLRL